MGAEKSQVWKERAVLAPEVNSRPLSHPEGFRTARCDPFSECEISLVGQDQHLKN